MKDRVSNMGKNKSATVIKYQKEHYDALTLRFKKNDIVIPLLNYATKTLKKTKGDYVRSALINQFTLDGITIDKLLLETNHTPTDLEPKQPRRYMIYIITEHFIYDINEKAQKYIAVFPTLKAAEKYANNKFSKKAYPADWTYTIWGRYMEGDNQREAWDKLKEIIKKELDKDRYPEAEEDYEFTYLERIDKKYPVEYKNVIKCNSEGVSSQDVDYDFSELEQLIKDEEDF